MEDTNDNFGLTPEQQDTAALLERLLGRAIANRYVDFSRLAASATGLRVSRPMAAHALRELESMIRSSLEVPMDAKATLSDEDEKKAELGIKALRGLGYDDETLRRAKDALAPRHNHANQIKLIVQRLGLSPEGDIATAWVSLCRTVGRAHERYYHRDQPVDREFLEAFQKPFELVLRSIVVALPKRYAALTQRVEALAAMPDYAKAAKLFRNEIPGALPLQWHFYQIIGSPRWLPHLLKQQLIAEPLATDEAAAPKRFGEWPVGHYLLKIAKSGDPSIGPLISEAIRTVAQSKHPDVRRQGLEIIAILPPDDADHLVDVVIAWLDADTRNFYQTAVQHLLKRLADGGHVQSAFKLAAAAFQLFEQGGEIITTHPQGMYEHYLPEAVTVLAGQDGLGAVHLFSRLLQQAVTITRKAANGDEHRDYTYSTPHSLVGDDMAQYGIYEALIIAVRNAALIASRDHPGLTSDVIAYLNSCRLKIFRRIALHVLSKNAGAAPPLATALLSDPELIGEAWCEDEYAELALAHFSVLTHDEQRRIFAIIDALPDRLRSIWRKSFAARERRPPKAEDERLYDLAVLRDAMWKWQDALPPSRKRLIDESVTAVGHPDAWRERLFPSEASPLTGADFSIRPIREILEFLRTWEPSEEPVRQTITALGQQLRDAVAKEPARFAEFAHEFRSVRPIYVRRLLEGFDSKARNNERLAWPRILELMRVIMERLKQPANTFAAADGDDTDWLWCAFAAATLLKSGLRQGDAGIAYEHGANIEVIICTLFDSAPRKPSTNDFEKTFKEHPYFAAEQSLRPFANSRERTCLTNAMSRSSKATMPFSKPSWRPRTPSSHPKIRRSPRFLNAITRPTRSFRVSSACCCCPRQNPATFRVHQGSREGDNRGAQ